MAEAPEAEAHDPAHDPAYPPDQAQSQATRWASRLAMTTDWPAISQAANSLDLDALRRELAAGVGVDTLVGPDDYGPNTGGRTPLQCVCEVATERIVYQRGGTKEAFLGWVASSLSRRREINEGIHADRVACVAFLLEQGASPTGAGPYASPLTGAAIHGSLAIVKMLLAAGSDANATCWMDVNRTISPLYILVLQPGRQHPTIVDALLKAGADANPPEFAGKTLMEWAIYGGHRDLWPVLLRGGAILPIRENPSNWGEYDTHRVHPYFQKIEAAGGFDAVAKAHRQQLLATFTPKFTHLVPPELVARIVEYSFHLGFY